MNQAYPKFHIFELLLCTNTHCTFTDYEGDNRKKSLMSDVTGVQTGVGYLI